MVFVKYNVIDDTVFACLVFCDNGTNIKCLPKYIAACCVLHNIVLFFVMFSVRPFLDTQEDILDIAEFNLAAMSSTLVPVVKIVVSSANSAEATGAIDCGGSLIT